MVSFSVTFILSMCDVGMCFSFSTALLFLIMTYDATAFRQDERRKRKQEQNVDCRLRKKAKKEKKINVLRERKKSRLNNGPIGDKLMMMMI